jgi:hypothetical protein
MKNMLIILLVFLFYSHTNGQEIKWPQVDVSTMDAITYPQEAAWRNYLTDDQRNITPKVKVIYSRPIKKGRDIFGGLVPFDSEWRLGANEATQITFYEAVRIGDTTVPPGEYTLFATVKTDAWDFHLSTESGIWGNANRDMNKTVATVSVPSATTKDNYEALSMTFQEIDDKHLNLVVAWDRTMAAMPISFDPIQFNPTDASPMDMAHYPSNSAFTNYLEGEEKNLQPKVQVTYSRPYKKGRDIFGQLLKSGSVWRIGANEATEIVFYQPVKIGDLELNRGRYSMFAELHKDYWEIIFSKDYPIWGAANRDITKDVGRATASVSMESEELENLSIVFQEKDENNVDMIIGWDKTRATINIMFK